MRVLVTRIRIQRHRGSFCHYAHGQPSAIGISEESTRLRIDVRQILAGWVELEARPDLVERDQIVERAVGRCIVGDGDLILEAQGAVRGGVEGVRPGVGRREIARVDRREAPDGVDLGAGEIRIADGVGRGDPDAIEDFAVEQIEQRDGAGAEPVGRRRELAGVQRDL